MWKGLKHKNVLPFLGVSEGVFEGVLCMVSPWLENGNVRRYLRDVVNRGELSGKTYFETIYRWVRSRSFNLGEMYY